MQRQLEGNAFSGLSVNLAALRGRRLFDTRCFIQLENSENKNNLVTLRFDIKMKNSFNNKREALGQWN